MAQNHEAAVVETFRSEPTFVQDYRLEGLRAELAKIAKRAAKLGVAAPTLVETGGEEFHERRTSTGDRYQVRFVEVVVEGETPVLEGGWRMLAVVDHRDGVVNAVPGRSCPPNQRDRGPVCDHCGRRDPRRTETFVLQSEDGVVRQVGRTCIGDFLGAYKMDPQLALRFAAAVADFAVGLGGEIDDREPGMGGPRVNPMMLWADLDDVLLWTAGWLVDNAWISGSKAWQFGGTPTRSCVADLIWKPHFSGRYAAEERKAYVEGKEQARAAIDANRERFVAEIEAAKAWVVEAAAADEENDYLAACATIVDNGRAQRRRFGYACSILSSYRRHVAKVERQKAEQPKLDEHVGTVGERLYASVRLVFEPKPIDGAFGTTYLHTFEDEAGRRIKWFGGHRVADDAGEVLVIRAKVKDHGEWNGHRETSVSHVTVISRGESAATVAARELVAAGEVARPADDPAMLALEPAVRFMKRARVWRWK